jgi:hypothetical protein
VKAGCAVRKYRVVKSDALDDLVFQSVEDGKPMQDNNILSRSIKPAASTLPIVREDIMSALRRKGMYLLQRVQFPRNHLYIGPLRGGAVLRRR